MESIAVKVPLSEGEKVKKELKRKGLLRTELKPRRENNHILFPVKKNVDGFEMVTEDFPQRRENPSSYKDVVDIPPHLKRYLPTSYDIIGDIILIKIPREVRSHGKEIGEALLKIHKNVVSVYHAEPVKGEYRLRNLKLLAGEPKTRTKYKEYGVELEVDVAKVFFSPRLSNERYRIAKLVRDNEVVIDMFAGCAPFSIVIAKHSNPKIIYAMDINTHAIELAKINVKKNKLLHKIEVIEGDSAEIAKDLYKLGVKADRIIMNHPFGEREFIKSALLLSKKGTFIHYYSILKEEEMQDFIEKIKGLTGNSIEVEKINKIKTYAPREFYTCFDIIVTRKPA